MKPEHKESLIDAAVNSLFLVIILVFMFYVVSANAVEYDFENIDGLTARGAPVLVDGREGKAASLDGVNDMYVVDIDSNGWTGITAAAWVKPADLGDDRVLCKSPSINGSDHIYSLGIANGKIRIRLTTDSGYGEYTTATLVKVNEWQHIAFTWSATSNTLAIYYNGEPVQLAEHSGNTLKASTQVTAIGNINTTDSRHFNGLIDGVIVSGEVIGVAGMAALANVEAEYTENLKFSWSAPTKRENGESVEVGDIKHYTIFADGDLLKTVTSTEYTQAFTEGAYTFTLSSTDIYGNESVQSSPVLIVIDGPEPTPAPNPVSPPVATGLTVERVN